MLIIISINSQDYVTEFCCTKSIQENKRKDLINFYYIWQHYSQSDVCADKGNRGGGVIDFTNARI